MEMFTKEIFRARAEVEGFMDTKVIIEFSLLLKDVSKHEFEDEQSSGLKIEVNRQNVVFMKTPQ
jgi:hypothetical protein